MWSVCYNCLLALTFLRRAAILCSCCGESDNTTKPHLRSILYSPSSPQHSHGITPLPPVDSCAQHCSSVAPCGGSSHARSTWSQASKGRTRLTPIRRWRGAIVDAAARQGQSDWQSSSGARLADMQTHRQTVGVFFRAPPLGEARPRTNAGNFAMMQTEMFSRVLDCTGSEGQRPCVHSRSSHRSAGIASHRESHLREPCATRSTRRGKIVSGAVRIGCPVKDKSRKKIMTETGSVRYCASPSLSMTTDS